MSGDISARAAHKLDSRTCVDCDTEVEVEVAVDGYSEYWTCPACGADHQDEHDTEPDPDDYNDAMAEMHWDD